MYNGYPVKTTEDVDKAMNNLTALTTETTRTVTPSPSVNNSEKIHKSSRNVQLLLQDKRKLRRQWQQNRSPITKSKLNKAIKNLKRAMCTKRDEDIQSYLKELTYKTYRLLSLESNQKTETPAHCLPSNPSA